MAKRLTICSNYIARGYPVGKVLESAGVPESTWYDNRDKAFKKDSREHNKGRPVPGHSTNPDGTIVLDSTIVSALKRYRTNPHYQNGGGYHKLTHYLRRDYGYHVNHKKIYRLCRENNLLLSLRRKKIRKNRRVSINREIYKPNQLWEFDIKYGQLHGLNKFFFILAYIDVYSRKIVNYYVGLACKGHNLSATLDFALEKAGISGNDLVIRSDNGPQMSSNHFREHLKSLELEIEHEFIPCATPNKNAHVESFFSIIEREFLEVQYFRDFADAARKLESFICFYNNERVHGSLGYKTPQEALEEFELNGYNPKIRYLRA